MKRIITYMLMLNILLVSSGLFASAHFCGKTLVSLNIGENSKKCCNSTESSSDNCCDDKTVVFEVDNKKVEKTNILNITKYVVFIKELYNINFNVSLSEHNINRFISSKFYPPSLKRYISYQNFRI